MLVGRTRAVPQIEDDAVIERLMMPLSITYDHRVVDGSLGGMFLKRVSDYLEGYDAHRTLL